MYHMTIIQIIMEMKVGGNIDWNSIKWGLKNHYSDAPSDLHLPKRFSFVGIGEADCILTLNSWHIRNFDIWFTRFDSDWSLIGRFCEASWCFGGSENRIQQNVIIKLESIQMDFRLSFYHFLGHYFETG